MNYITGISTTQTMPGWAIKTLENYKTDPSIYTMCKHATALRDTLVDDVKTIYAEGQPIGVKVYFADGTVEKAICEEGDRPNFSLDFGITICLCKKLMGGSHNYNRKIRAIHKDMEAKAYAEALKRERERQTNEAKQKARQEEARKKREALEREIEIQKEAYLRAMREFQNEKFPDMQLPDHG